MSTNKVSLDPWILQGRIPETKLHHFFPCSQSVQDCLRKCCLCKVCGAANHPTLGTASNRQWKMKGMVAPNVETECYPAFLLQGVSGILTLVALPAAQLPSPSGIHYACWLTCSSFRLLTTILFSEIFGQSSHSCGSKGPLHWQG